jgi:arabinogalactan endo-1,4-beta-galactosidase
MVTSSHGRLGLAKISADQRMENFMKKTNKLIVPITVAVIVLLAALFLTLVLPQLTSRRLAPLPPDFHVNPVDGLGPDFVLGADVSMLRQIELSGGRFYVNGVEADALQILKDHGVNWIRLRIWNDPTDEGGDPVGGGNNDLAATVDIASRAKRLGLKFLLDFHYSDWWADPGQQNKPRAWADLEPAALEQALYDYTAEVIRTLVEAEAAPDMVQLGNEINGGMLWPEGQTFEQGERPVGGFDGLAALLNEGIRAVRDNDPRPQDPARRIRIMIHLAEGGDNGLFRSVFDALTERGVEFDVIGLSYYSFWHGPLEDLVDNMNDISARYGKPVVVAETAYAYTLEEGDGHSNLFGSGLEQFGGYRATIQGQASAVRDVIAAVAQVPEGRGLGIFYWEPDWIPVPGAGWRTGEGDAWENMAMFDFAGNALASLNVFRLVRPGSSDFVPATAVELLPLEIRQPLGASLELPAVVRAVFSDDSIRRLAVTWESFDPALLEQGGTFSVAGTAAGTDLPARADVSVSSQRNFAANPGFETGDLSGWTVTGNPEAVDVSSEAQNIYRDTYAAHYWLGGPFQFTLYQTVTGLASGTYTFSLWIQGGGGEDRLQLFARDCGGETRTVEVENTGWQAWSGPTIEGISVTEGTCTIGLTAVSSGGSWAFIDAVEFSPDD